MGTQLTYSFRAFKPFYSDQEQCKKTKADQCRLSQTKAGINFASIQVSKCSSIPSMQVSQVCKYACVCSGVCSGHQGHQTNKRTNKQTNKQTNLTNKQTDKQTDKQTNKTNKQTNKT